MRINTKAYMLCESDLDSLFPRRAEPFVALREPGDIALQALPTAVVLLAWMGLEVLLPRRAAITRSAKRQGGVLGVLCVGGLGLLAWHAFDRIECVSNTALMSWRLVAVIGAPLLALVLLVVGTRFARAALLMAILLGGATVGAEWAVRDILPVTIPWAAVQHLWLLIGVLLFPYLPRTTRFTSATRRLAPVKPSKTSSSIGLVTMQDKGRAGGGGLRSTAASALPEIDPLAVRRQAGTEENTTTLRNWFV